MDQRAQRLNIGPLSRTCAHKARPASIANAQNAEKTPSRARLSLKKTTRPEGRVIVRLAVFTARSN